VTVVVALLVAVAAGLAADVEPSEFRYTRTLAAPAGAPVVVEPDGAMYGHAGIDFPDLRIVDASGTQVPWRSAPLPAAVPLQPVALVARGRLGDTVSVVVDRGVNAEVVDRIELTVPDQEFVGDVEVLGSTTGAEASYATLSTTPIYSVQGAVDARSTTAVFPPTDYRFLLVRASGVSDITAASVARDPSEPLLGAVPAEVRTTDRARTTVVRLDLGFANVPVDAIRIRSATDQFVRNVTIEGSNRRTGFTFLGSGEVARFRGVDIDRIDVAARQRFLRVTIENGDDAPLAGLRVTAEAKPRPLLLADGHEPPFELYYGSRLAAAPAYDFERLPAAATGIARAREGRLGPELLNELFEPPVEVDKRTFFEKNDALIQVLLVLAALVVAVGGILALRRRA
jgi:hypothetical protein